MSSFSIIICTYNPEQEILRRLLRAVASFSNIICFNYEINIIDNNSKIPVKETEEFKEFKKLAKNLNIYVETKPGLTNARRKGVEVSKNEWLIFFDDDNEPAPNYLDEAYDFIKRNDKIGAFGPGNISVEFIGSSQKNWVEEYKYLFQYISINEEKIANITSWQEFYPVGTGMVIKRDIMVSYIDKVNKKIFTLSDRKGKNLSSGGDVQMVLNAIRLGYLVGTIPQLRMNHLICSKKRTLSYIQKQCFGTASAFILAHEEVFPEKLYDRINVSNFTILYKMYGVFRNTFTSGGIKGVLIKLATVMGEIKARYLNGHLRPPVLFRIYEKLLNG